MRDIKYTNKNKTYYDIVKDILENDEYLKLKDIKHHGLDRYEHNKRVSYYSYLAAKILRLDYHEEQLANGIFESMIMKRTINSFFHIEAEEFIVMNEMISNSIHEDESKTEDSNNDEDKTDDDNDSEEEYASEDDYEDDAEYESHYIMDDNGRYYDAESWYEDHMNPPGTTDCGDGYLDADGVFTEY